MRLQENETCMNSTEHQLRCRLTWNWSVSWSMLKAHSKGPLFISFRRVQTERSTTPKAHDSKLPFQGHLHWSGICLRFTRTGACPPRGPSKPRTSSSPSGSTEDWLCHVTQRLGLLPELSSTLTRIIYENDLLCPLIPKSLGRLPAATAVQQSL